MKIWKVLGVAGVAGVGATGVIVARNERRRAQLTPDEVRSRLQQRYAEAAAAPIVPEETTVLPATTTRSQPRRWPTSPRWGRRS